MKGEESEVNVSGMGGGGNTKSNILFDKDCSLGLVKKVGRKSEVNMV